MMALFAALATPLDAAQAQVADLEISVTDSPDPVSPDGNITYTITVMNNGPDPAIADLHMQNAGTLQFQSLSTPAGWSCSAPPVDAVPTMSCSNASFSVGAQVFTLVVNADPAIIGINDTSLQMAFSVSSITPDPNSGNNTETETTAYVAPDADLAVTLSGPATATSGDQATYTFSVTNNGPDTAPDVVVSNGLQPGMTFVSLTQNAGPAFNCTTPAIGDNGAIVCTNASFASGQTASFTMVATLPSGATALNAVVAASAVADPNVGNNTAMVTTTLSSPQPQITGVSPNTGRLSGGATVTITGQNFTGATAVTFGGTAAWSFQVDSATTISATAPGAAAAGEVAVAVTTPLGTAEAPDAFTFMGAPSLVVTAPSGAVTVDEAFEVTLTVTNDNAAALEGLAVGWFDAPDGVTLQNATPSQGSVSGNTATLGSLAAGATATVTLQYATDGPALFGFRAYTTATNAPPDEANATVTVQEVSDVAVAISAPATVDAGDTLTFAITASTTGPNPASGVELTVELPAALSFQSLTPGLGWSCTTPAVGQSGTLTCSPASRLGDASPGLFSLVTAVSAGASGPVTTTASISTTSEDPAAGNNSSSVEVSVISSAPVASDVNANVAYNTAGTIQLAASGAVTSMEVDQEPAHGEVVISGSEATYTPDDGYFGADSFTYVAVGPGGTSAPATVTITVATPAAPTVADVSDVDIAYNSQGEDIDLQITGVFTGVTVATDPAHGTVTIDGTTATYVPDAGYFGDDSFTVAATGPGGTSSPATVSLTVVHPGPPTIVSISGVSVPYNSQGEDFELQVSGVFTGVTVASAPLHGTATIDGTTLTYTPETDYIGPVSFTIVAQGVGTAQGFASVDLTVAAPAAPVAQNLSGVAVAYNSAGTEIDLPVTGVFSSVAVTSPSHGAVTLAGTIATYTPAAGYFGADSFTFTATGPGGTSSAATVGLTVATPAAPTVQSPNAISLTITEAQPNPTATIDLSAQASGVFTEISVDTEPQHGSVSLVTTARPGQTPLVVATYTADADYAGADSFTFVATGPGGDSTPGAVSLSISGTTPVLAPLTATTAGGVLVTVDLTGSVDEGPFTGAAIVSISTPGSGTATIVEGDTAGAYRLEFQPLGAFSGPAVVTYTLSNRFGASAPGTVLINVTARAIPTSSVEVTGVMYAQSSVSMRFATTYMNTFMEQMASSRAVALGADDEEILEKKKKAQGSKKKKSNSLQFNGLSDLPEPDLDGPFPGITARLEAEHSRDDWFLNLTEPKAAQDADGGEAPNAEPESSGPASAWVGGSVTFGRREGGSGKAVLNIVTSGVSAGVDVRLSPNAMVGAGVGYGRDITDVGSEGSRVETSSWVGVAYGSLIPADGFFIDGLLGRGELNFDIDRAVTATDVMTTADRDGDLLFAAVASGFERRRETWSLSSYGRVSVSRADLGEYTEQGGGLDNLSYASREVRSLVGALGIRGEILHELRSGFVMPRARLEVLHEFEDDAGQQVRYADWVGGPTYLVPGSNSGRDRLRLGVGNAAILQNGWTIDFDAEAEVAEDQVLGTFRLKAEKAF
jgi:uncharacterized repeat protein (TIGR01451 family)